MPSSTQPKISLSSSCNLAAYLCTLHPQSWSRLAITVAVLVGISIGLVGCASGPSHSGATAEPPAQDLRFSGEQDAWAHLSRQFDMPMPTRAADRARVQRYVDFYLNNPKVVTVSLTRAEPWAEYMLSELNRRKMPSELFFVPLIESGFSARATSPSGAAGIWQFMPATGSHYGLRQTAEFDGRRDVFASTDAALDYLETLYARFDDWLLVLAAYNFGQGNVARAMEANQQRGARTDYWSLQLSNDAMGYVPKILALREIVENRRLPLPPQRPSHTVVGIPLDQAVDLQRVASLTQVPLDELRQLNPATRTSIIPAYPGTHLALPRSALPKLEQARGGLQAAAASDQPVAARRTISQGGEHIVQPGDTLWGIAARYGVDLGELGEINQLPRGATTSPGQRLSLPAPAQADSSGQQHRIQPGDTLYTIARLYGVTLDALRQANHIADDLLRVGETLAIPR